MHPSTLLRLAAIITSLTILLASYFVIPALFQNTQVAIALILFAIAVAAFGFVVPVPATQRNNGTSLALLGPSSAFASGLLAWTTFVVAASYYLSSSFILAMNIITVGSILVANLVLRASATVISEAIEASNFKSAHIAWRDHLSLMAAQTTDPETKQRLLTLSEKAGFLSRDPDTSGSEFNNEISMRLQELTVAIQESSGATINSLLPNVDLLFSKREAANLCRKCST